MTQILADADASVALFKSMSRFSKTAYPSRYRFAYGSVLALKSEALLWKAKVLNGGDDAFRQAIETITEIETTGVRLNLDFKDVARKRAAENPEVLMAAYYHRDEVPGGNYAKNALPFKDIIEGALNKDSLPLRTLPPTVRAHTRSALFPARCLPMPMMCVAGIPG